MGGEIVLAKIVKKMRTGLWLIFLVSKVWFFFSAKRSLKFDSGDEDTVKASPRKGKYFIRLFIYLFYFILFYFLFYFFKTFVFCIVVALQDSMDS